MTGSNVEAVCSDAMKIVLVRKKVAASCVTVAKFDAYALLSAQVSESPHFANIF
jgi:hypothetical protein